VTFRKQSPCTASPVRCPQSPVRCVQYFRTLRTPLSPCPNPQPLDILNIVTTSFTGSLAKSEASVVMEGPLNACHFVLATHQPCRAPALHNNPYCRHHTPAALARRQARFDDLYSDTPPASQPPQRTGEEIEASHLRAYWRKHHRIIAESYDDEQCKEIYDMILMALGERAISPCSAGKLLLAVMERRKVLAHLAQQAAWARLEERTRLYQRQTAAGQAPDPKPLMEAFKTVVVSSPELFPLPDTRATGPLEASTTTVFSAPQPVRPDGPSF
jgi:hypothetical protein